MINGFVKQEFNNRIVTITFFHPKSNSLPSNLLIQLTDTINELSDNNDISIIILKGDGEKAFCAGASFDELIEIDNFNDGKNFFMGFANVINAIRKCKKIVIGRIHGKAVGGGVGLVAACDYCLASDTASLRLSELAIGLGPFVVGPPIERKIGKELFVEMSLDCKWRTADWAKNHGLYNEIYETIYELDSSLQNFAEELSERSVDALVRLKKVFWEGTEHWDQLLEKRAEYSGELILSDHTKKFIEDFKSSR